MGGLMEKIANNVYVQVATRGCNHSFVATKEGVVMIDTPMFPEDAAKWRNEIAKFGPVRYLVNTEPHGDHVSGNYFFEGIGIAHEGTRIAILESTAEQYGEMLKRMGGPDITVPAGFRYKAPTITFSEKLTFYLGDHTFELIHLPGHSPFQLCVFVPEERVVFTSDNVTNVTPPFMHQALPYDWLNSLKQMQKLEADRFVPGHGPVCGKDHLATMVSVVQGAIDAVKSAVQQGMSLDEAQRKVRLYGDRFPQNERLDMVQRMGIARLYEILQSR
jgi:glyoxylase-like metal-dependent hydrolase (beta-lactamase superfamily II)